MKTYSSGNLLIPSGAGNNVIEAIHGFGSAPNFYAGSLVCIIADGTYSPGDEVPLADIISSLDAQNGGAGQADMFADAIRIYFATNNPVSGMAEMIGTSMIVTKTGGSSQAIIVSNWNIRFDVILF